MTKILWDQVGEKVYETGVDHGVLYLPDNTGDYDTGFAWNGLTTVTETPSGAESNAQYADNIKYINLLSAEDFGGTIEAFTYPEEFEQCDGTASVNGVRMGQQGRKTFGMSYRTRIGNDVAGDSFGYKLHLVYGATASPSERAYATVNDSPEAINFSWEFTTTPVPVGTIGGTEYKPTAILSIPSTDVNPTNLAALETILYGAVGVDPRLPTPAEVIALFAGALTTVNLTTSANQPSYNSGTHVVTLPTVTGIQWKINGVNKSPGAQPAMTTGQVSNIQAVPTTGYVLSSDSDDDWIYAY